MKQLEYFSYSDEKVKGLIFYRRNLMKNIEKFIYVKERGINVQFLVRKNREYKVSKEFQYM